MQKVVIDGTSLTIEGVVKVARQNHKVTLSPTAVKNVGKGNKIIKKILAANETVYGINTGFGALKDEKISHKDIKQMQKNFIRSHAAGVGKPFPEETVRAILLLRANALASGNSGVRLVVVQQIIDFLNKGIHPYIPQKGSLGASGDLAPLAHLALVLIGEGKAYVKGKLLPGKEALVMANLPPLTLEAKEGLALCNGTQVMTAVAALTIYDTQTILQTADIIAAMSIDALKGSDTAFDPRIHKLRKQEGQKLSAENVRSCLKESEIRKSHVDCKDIQDAYSLRCTPQVHGASRDVLTYAQNVVTKELNAITDNPIVFLEAGEILSGGNFHGQPVALAMDALAIALSEIANIAERRIDRLLNPHLRDHLPSFLVENHGLSSGFMIAQYTAAALVSENKVLSHPASVDSIPTSANQEDHVSMGTIAARKAYEIAENVRTVLTIEWLCASQALDFIKLKPGKGVQLAHKLARKHISHLDVDRSLTDDINKAADLIAKRTLIFTLESHKMRLR